jgi:retinol dehydrogenase 12
MLFCFKIKIPKKSDLSGKTPEAGAQTSLYCCLEESIADDSGKYYSDCREKTPSARARNAEDAKKLWAISEKLTNLHQE